MKNQKGMTLLGMLFTMALIIVLGLVTMRVVPIYIEHYQVLHALDNVNNIPQSDFSSDQATNASLIRSKIRNQLDIDGIQTIKDENITIKPKDDSVLLLIAKYQIIKPLFGNLKILGDFEDVREVKVRGS